METVTTAQFQTLQPLIAMMLDGERLYLAAAKAATERRWKDMFEEYAVQRREFAQQLEHLLPETERESNPVSAETLIEASIDSDLIHVCATSDASIATAFRRALNTFKLRDAQAVVSEQAAEIEHVYDQLQSLSA